MIRSHYDNLQVARNASDTVIRAAYKGLAQKYHPDRFDGDPSVAERIMKLLNEAYAVLSDPVRRKEHDNWLDEQHGMKDRKSLGESEAATKVERQEESVETEVLQFPKWTRLAKGLMKYGFILFIGTGLGMVWVGSRTGGLSGLVSGSTEWVTARIVTTGFGLSLGSMIIGAVMNMALVFVAEFLDGLNGRDSASKAAPSRQQSDFVSGVVQKQKKSIWNFDLDRIWPYLLQRPILMGLVCTGYLFFLARKPKGSMGELATPGGLGVFLGLAIGVGAIAWVVWFVLSRIAPQALAGKRASTLSLIMATITLALLIGNSV